MNFIAGIRSSVTYEWRRAVPGRRPQEERLLDAFEQQVNDQFSRVVCDAVDQLDRFPEPAAKEVIWAAEEELEGIGERLAVARSLIVTHLQGVEGAIRYVTQSDLMRTAAATGSH